MRISFNIYFLPISNKIFSNSLKIYLYIQYGRLLRRLQNHEGNCIKSNNEIEEEVKFNCEIGIINTEIKNIELIKNFDFMGQKVDIKGISPLANIYMDNLQNVKGNDLLEKKIYFLKTFKKLYKIKHLQFLYQV